MQLFCSLPPLYVGVCGLFQAWFRDYHEIFNLVPKVTMEWDFLGVFLASRWVLLSKKGKKVNIHERSVTDCIIVFKYFFPSLVLGREYFPAPLILDWARPCDFFWGLMDYEPVTHMLYLNRSFRCDCLLLFASALKMSISLVGLCLYLRCLNERTHRMGLQS